MSRELTEVEADSLHTELKEAVATFFGGSCSHSSSFEVRILQNLRLNLYLGSIRFLDLSSLKNDIFSHSLVKRLE